MLDAVPPQDSLTRTARSV